MMIGAEQSTTGERTIRSHGDDDSDDRENDGDDNIDDYDGATANHERRRRGK